MASTLIHIKSRLLLPEKDGEGDGEDPREEITRPLLEYLQFKELAGELSERALLERDVFKRGPVNDYSDFETEDVPLDVNLFQLMDAFKRILENNIPDAEITYEADRLSVKDRISMILDNLREKTTLFFNELFNEDRTIAEFVVTFLAVLELVHIGLVRVYQPSMDNEIRLEARFEDDDEENEHEQITEDDN
jgi:segregation and condensation protein A